MSYKASTPIKFNGVIDLSLVKHLTCLNLSDFVIRYKMITPTYKVDHKFITQLIINQVKGIA